MPPAVSPAPGSPGADGPGPSAAGARARVRVELMREITDAGRAELAEVGPAALSLRAVARRLGMAPSALYRYYASRDHLLTALIVDAYNALAATAAAADATSQDPGRRWMALGRALREWSGGHPHEWALVFGSPVPGFVGSEETTAAATGLHRVPIELLVDAAGAGVLDAPGGLPVPPAVAASVAPMAALAPGLDPAVATAALAAWAQVLGAISLERFGHFVGAVDDQDAWFDHCLRLAGGLVGLRVGGGAPAVR